MSGQTTKGNKAEKPSPRKRKKMNYKKLVFDEDENKNI